VPVDGLWVDGVWYFGGHADTVHQRNLRNNPEVAIHLADTTAASSPRALSNGSYPP
jgi:hypothetical protein